MEKSTKEEKIEINSEEEFQKYFKEFISTFEYILNNSGIGSEKSRDEGKKYWISAIKEADYDAIVDYLLFLKNNAQINLKKFWIEFKLSYNELSHFYHFVVRNNAEDRSVREETVRKLAYCNKLFEALDKASSYLTDREYDTKVLGLRDFVSPKEAVEIKKTVIGQNPEDKASKEPDKAKAPTTVKKESLGSQILESKSTVVPSRKEQLSTLQRMRDFILNAPRSVKEYYNRKNEYAKRKESLSSLIEAQKTIISDLQTKREDLKKAHDEKCLNVEKAYDLKLYSAETSMKSAKDSLEQVERIFFAYFDTFYDSSITFTESYIKLYYEKDPMTKEEKEKRVQEDMDQFYESLIELKEKFKIDPNSSLNPKYNEEYQRILAERKIMEEALEQRIAIRHPDCSIEQFAKLDLTNSSSREQRLQNDCRSYLRDAKQSRKMLDREIINTVCSNDNLYNRLDNEKVTREARFRLLNGSVRFLKGNRNAAIAEEKAPIDAEFQTDLASINERIADNEQKLKKLKNGLARVSKSQELYLRRYKKRFEIKKTSVEEQKGPKQK